MRAIQHKDQHEVGRLLNHWWALLAGVAMIVPLILFLLPMDGGFLYDDARMVLLNDGSALHLLKSFLELRDGFYRPVFELLIGIEGNAFGTNPLPYHLVNILIHGFCSLLIYRIARVFAPPPAAILSALLFWGEGTHVEAVFWISGLHSLSAAIGCLGALLSLELACRATTKSDRDRLCLLGLACWLVGLLGKENAFTFPIAVFALWYVQAPDRPNVFSSRFRFFFLPAALGMLIYAPLRLAAGTGYHIELSPTLLAKNAVYYLVSVLTPLPDDYRYLSDLTAWRANPLLGTLALIAVAVVAGWLWMLRANLNLRGALGWLIWSAIVALPALPIIAERENYLPSAGVCLALAALVGPLLKPAGLDGAFRRRALTSGVIVFGLLLIINWVALLERAFVWRQAAVISDETVRYVLDATANDPPGTAVAIDNVPDRYHFAHIQGAHICWTLELLSDHRITTSTCSFSVSPDGVADPNVAPSTDARSQLERGQSGSPSIHRLVLSRT